MEERARCAARRDVTQAPAVGPRDRLQRLCENAEHKRLIEEHERRASVARQRNTTGDE
jgi:hypothetical protein